jgi:hypothetical protein
MRQVPHRRLGQARDESDALSNELDLRLLDDAVDGECPGL